MKMRALDSLLGAEITEGSINEFSAFLKVRFPLGNYLVLTDEESALIMAKALKRVAKKLLFVCSPSEDVLPLFINSDAITCVVGAGRACNAARYFAGVRSLPFVAVCLSCESVGLLANRVCVTANGAEYSYPVPSVKAIFADMDMANENRRGILLARAFLFSAELSRFSCSALRLLEGGGEEVSELPEALFSAACDASKENTSLFRAVLTVEYCFREGYPEGEVFRLCRLLEKMKRGEVFELLYPCVRALAKLYMLFFENGFYRGGKVDYNARFSEAERLAEDFGVELNGLHIPTAALLRQRAKNFEENKDELAEQMRKLCRRIEEAAAAFAEVGMKTELENADKFLRLLPEFFSDRPGILTIMRDFSLL